MRTNRSKKKPSPMVHALRGYLLPPHDPRVPPSGYVLLARMASAMREQIRQGRVVLLAEPHRTRSGARAFNIVIANLRPWVAKGTADSVWIEQGLHAAVRAFGRPYDKREAAAFLKTLEGKP